MAKERGAGKQFLRLPWDQWIAEFFDLFRAAIPDLMCRIVSS
jgi:hypothetical protein